MFILFVGVHDIEIHKRSFVQESCVNSRQFDLQLQVQDLKGHEPDLALQIKRKLPSNNKSQNLTRIVSDFLKSSLPVLKLFRGKRLIDDVINSDLHSFLKFINQLFRQISKIYGDNYYSIHLRRPTRNLHLGYALKIHSDIGW